MLCALLYCHKTIKPDPKFITVLMEMGLTNRAVFAVRNHKGLNLFGKRFKLIKQVTKDSLLRNTPMQIKRQKRKATTGSCRKPQSIRGRGRGRASFLRAFNRFEALSNSSMDEREKTTSIPDKWGDRMYSMSLYVLGSS